MSTFGDLQGFVYTQLGGSASLAASTKTQVKFFINAALQRITRRQEWWFLKREKEIYTLADEEAGTACVTNGNVAVGGTGTAWTAAEGVIAGSLVRFGSDNEVYEINSVASSTRFDLKSAYRGTTATGAAASAWQQHYDLGSDIHTILNVRDMTTPQDLDFITSREADGWDPGYDQAGPPTHFTLHVRPSNNNQQIGLYPRADSVRQLRVRYKKRVADMSSTTSTPPIPAHYHELLAWGAMAEVDLFEYERRQDYMGKFERGIAEMARDEPVVTDRQWRRYRYSGGRAVGHRGGRLPPQYEGD